MGSYKMDSKEKQRIFDVAMALMEDVGFEKLGIRQICKEADISIGKFYCYFDSKQQLLAFFYKNLEAKFRGELFESLQGLDIREQIVRFYVWFNSYLTSFGLEFVRNFFSNQNPILNTHVYNNEIIAITDELLGRAVQDGLKLSGNSTIRNMSDDFCIIIKGIVFDWCVRHGEFDISVYTEDLLRRCMRGILPEDPTAR